MSQYWSILQAVKGVLADALDGIPVVVRKRPFVSIDHGDVLPTLCLSPTVERIAEKQMNNGVWVEYQVQILFVQDRGTAVGDPAALSTQLQTRETVRLALCKTHLDAVPKVFGFAYDPAPAFDTGGLDQVYDCSLQQITYKNAEPRSA